MKSENNTCPQLALETRPETSRIETAAATSPPGQLTVDSYRMFMLIRPAMKYATFREYGIRCLVAELPDLEQTWEIDNTTLLDKYPLSLALLIVRAKEGFPSLMAILPIEEAMEGIHSQASLNMALDSCTSLTCPPHQCGVDTREIYRFLCPTLPFSLWIHKRVSDLMMVEGRDYTRTLREITKGKKSGCLPVYRWEIAVTAPMAELMSLDKTSPRGRRFIRYASLCAEIRKRDLDKSLEEIFQAKWVTA